MKQLTYEKAKDLFKLWEKEAHEDVFLCEIEINTLIIKATTEYQETTESLRIVAYDNGFGWLLDEYYCEKLMETSIYDILSELQGIHNGDMYHFYETEEEHHQYSTVYDCMWQFAESPYEPLVLDMTTEDFSSIFDLLKPGSYLIHLSDADGNKGGVEQ